MRVMKHLFPAVLNALLRAGEKAIGPKNRMLIPLRDHLAATYVRQQDFAGAQELYERSVEFKKAIFGINDLRVAKCHVDLGDVTLLLLDQQRRLNSRFPHDPRYEVAVSSDEAVSHYRQAIEIRKGLLGIDHSDLLDVLDKQVATHYQEEELRQALDIRESTLGSNHLGIVPSLDILASYYARKKEDTQAKALYQRSLTIKELSLGPTHHTIANTLECLAEIDASQGEPLNAVSLYKRSLAIRKRASREALGSSCREFFDLEKGVLECLEIVAERRHLEGHYQSANGARARELDPIHLDEALSNERLARIYDREGKYAEANLHYEDALAIWGRCPGAGHPEMRKSVGNLRMELVFEQPAPLRRMYQSTLNTLEEIHERYNRSEDLYCRSLALREAKLDPNHPHVITALTHLADMWCTQGKYSDAEPLYIRAANTAESKLGSQNSLIVYTIEKLANFYCVSDQPEKMRPALQRSVAARMLAPNMVGVVLADSLSNAAETWRSKGKIKFAATLEWEALAIREKHLGRDHPDLAQCIDILAGLQIRLEDFKAAESFYRRSLLLRETTLGPEHFDVATSCGCLARLYLFQERFEEAEAFLERSLSTAIQCLGPLNLEIATRMESFARLYYVEDHSAKVISLYSRALDIKTQLYGAEHQEIARSLEYLARACENHQVAQDMYSRSLAIYERVYGADHVDVANCLDQLAYTYLQKWDPWKKSSWWDNLAWLYGGLALCLGRPQALKGLPWIYDRRSDYSRFLELQERSLGIRERVQGACHPDFVDAIESAFRTCQMSYQLERAAKYEALLASTKKKCGL